jgi:hypothetical protein
MYSFSQILCGFVLYFLNMLQLIKEGKDNEAKTHPAISGLALRTAPHGVRHDIYC